MKLQIGQRVPEMQLCREVRDLVRESGRSQTSLASELGVSPAAIARAISEPGRKWVQIQTKIIEQLSGQELTIIPQLEFVVKKKTHPNAEKVRRHGLLRAEEEAEAENLSGS